MLRTLCNCEIQDHASGLVTTIAGSGSTGSTDGAGSAAQFYNPYGLAVDNRGILYVADTNNYTIRKITSDGVVSTLAGAAGSIGSIDGTGSAARFGFPVGVAVDSSGNVYVADNGNSTIRRITSSGVVTTIAGVAGKTGSMDGNGGDSEIPLSKWSCTRQRRKKSLRCRCW